MKRTIALVLTLLFVLTMIPTVNTAKAEEIRPLSIEVATKATKRVYEVGESLDLTGFGITYYDGITQPGTAKTMTDYVASDPAEGKFMTSIANGYTFKAEDVGTKTITVTYNAGTPEGHTHIEKPTTTFKISVVAADVGYLTGISVVTPPDTTEYYEGETLELGGLTLQANYSNGGNPDLALSDCTITPSTEHQLETGDTHITITYSKAYEAQTLTYTYDYATAADPKPATDPTAITVNPALASINFAAGSLQLSFDYDQIGTSQQIVCDPALTDPDAVTWGSSNPEVATVDSSGNVTAVTPGSVIVTATTRGSNKQAICAVTVKSNEIEPSHIALNKTETTLGVNATDELTVTYTPSNATVRNIEWSILMKDGTDATDYISIDADGNITAKKATPAGIPVVITAEALDPSDASYTPAITATCEVTVIEVFVDSITMSQSTAALHAGSSITLDAYVLPLNASNPTITWGTSDSDWAEVVDGVVTTHAFSTDSADYPKTVTITATAGTHTTSCVITLNYATLLTEVNLSKTSASMSVGDTMNLTVSTAPSGATNKTLKWTSSNPAVAEVDSSGKVTAKAAGSTVIKVAATDGSFLSASCSVSVSTVNVLIISLSSTSLSLVEGNSAALTATVYPSNATKPALQWSSSNTSVATVDTNGKVTARNVTGYAIIKASATDGSGKFAECVVIAKAKVAVTGVTLNYGTSLDLLLGDSTKLVATILPSTATNPEVTWKSSNTSIATIDKDGLLKSVALGETTITATADGKSVTMTVTVTNSEYNYGVAANFRRRVNVRSSASGLSKLVGYAYLGDTFKILGKTGNWYYIQYNKTTKAYIWANYIKASKTSTGYTSAGTTSGTSPSPGSSTAAPTTVTITNCLYAVNVRSGPSTTNDRIGKAKLGATYTYLAKEGDWYKVQYTTTTIGYIYGTFVALS